MNINMINNLIRSTSVVFQNVVLHCTDGYRELLCGGEELAEFWVRHMVELLAVGLGIRSWVWASYSLICL